MLCLSQGVFLSSFSSHVMTPLTVNLTSWSRVGDILSLLSCQVSRQSNCNYDVNQTAAFSMWSSSEEDMRELKQLLPLQDWDVVLYWSLKDLILLVRTKVALEERKQTFVSRKTFEIHSRLLCSICNCYPWLALSPLFLPHSPLQAKCHAIPPLEESERVIFSRKLMHWTEFVLEYVVR
jgi:hypothetical protein